jgi:hypothetical protein
MCYVPLITHICCGLPWFAVGRELPVIKTCKNAKIDFTEQGPGWTGCPVREPKFVPEMKYPLLCDRCSEPDGYEHPVFRRVQGYSSLLDDQVWRAARPGIVANPVLAADCPSWRFLSLEARRLRFTCLTTLSELGRLLKRSMAPYRRKSLRIADRNKARRLFDEHLVMSVTYFRLLAAERVKLREQQARHLQYGVDIHGLGFAEPGAAQRDAQDDQRQRLKSQLELCRRRDSQTLQGLVSRRARDTAHDD